LSQLAIIRVYHEAGNVIETHEHKGWPQQTEFVQPRNQQQKMQLKIPSKAAESFDAWKSSALMLRSNQKKFNNQQSKGNYLYGNARG
jgi:hypothetical protein